MASVTVFNKFKTTNYTSSDHGTWSNWKTGNTSIATHSTTGYAKTALFRVDIDYTGAQSLDGISITVTCQNSSSTSYSTFGCYVYTYQPSAPSTDPPSGYIDNEYESISGANTQRTITFTFTGLSVTSSSLYFLFYCGNVQTVVVNIPSSASGSFTLEPITMSLSSSSVTTGGNQVVTFPNGSGRSVSVAVKYNNTTLWSGSTSSGSLTIPVTKSWFSTAGITTYREISVSIQATEADTGTIYDSFKIVAGSDMNPTVGTPTVSIVQASGKPTTYFPSTYLANISKAKVAVSVSSGSNASIATVVLNYTGGSQLTMYYNSSTGKYEATTSELVSSSTSFTVTATDGRKYNINGTNVGGMSASATSSAVSVVQYTAPSINIDSGATFRCTQGGTLDSGGAYFLAKAAATYYTSLSGNSLLEFSVKIDAFSTVYDDLVSNVQYGPKGGNMVATTEYALVFTIEDKVSPAITKSFPLGSKVRDLVARHNSTGTAFGVGTTPQTAAGSSVEMAMGGRFMVGGFLWGSLTSLQYGTDGASFGRDFRSVEVNTKYDSKNAEAAFSKPASDSLWSNIPSARSGSQWAGLRRVIWVSGSMILIQILEFYPVAGRIWWNYYDGSSWSGWRYSSSTT